MNITPKGGSKLSHEEHINGVIAFLRQYDTLTLEERITLLYQIAHLMNIIQEDIDEEKK